MVSFSSLYSLALLVSLSATVLAAPHPIPSSVYHMDLTRRSQQAKTYEEVVAWAKAHKLNVEAKYGNPSSLRKRGSSGQNLLVNQDADSSFFGSLAIGTPAVAYDIILDTGSADLWLAGSTCDEQSCSGIPLFDPSTSSSFQNLSTPFSITYGSGEAAGTLGQDVVQMAGFSVSNQVFAVCDEVSNNLLDNPVSGLMGLAFQSISSSEATPFWQTLASSGAWSEPLMAIQLTRFTNDSSVQSLEPGGTFTMGATNTSLFTGSIDYNDVPDGEETYWLQTISSLTAQGASVDFGSGTDAQAAIDTGTTLIGGPSDAVAALYSNIQGAEAGTGDLEGYYTYPCSTNVDVTVAFGGQSWSISNADFQAQPLNGGQCLGAFFALSTGNSAPSWIFGDTFLKNVYTVFRYNPASVGFAQLSETALSMNGANAAIPSATIGSAAATVTASSSSGSRAGTNHNGAVSLSGLSISTLFIAMTMLYFSIIHIC